MTPDRGRWRRGGIAPLLMLLVGTAAIAEPASLPPSGEWNFQVRLDGTPIGEHRFRLETEGDAGRLTSEARFDVKVLGFTVYRYRHSAVEHWRGACLASIDATTDDDGKASQVHLAAADERGAVRVVAATPTLDGCMMSFAYWHPAMHTQTRLLNAQTGKIETVRVERLAEARVEVHGEPVVAHGYRVSGAGRPIDVWYAADGRWIGLDSVVGEHRQLSYRLP